MSDNVDEDLHWVNKNRHVSADYFLQCVSMQATSMFTKTYIDEDLSHMDNARMAKKPALAERLRHWRKVRGLTQGQLATMAGLAANGRQTIGNIENGELPRHDTIVKLAGALKISPRDLLGEPLAVSGKTLSEQAVALAEMFDDLRDDAFRDAVWATVELFPRRDPAPEEGLKERVMPQSDATRTVGDTGETPQRSSDKRRTKKKRARGDESA